MGAWTEGLQEATRERLEPKFPELHEASRNLAEHIAYFLDEPEFNSAALAHVIARGMSPTSFGPAGEADLLLNAIAGETVADPKYLLEWDDRTIPTSSLTKFHEGIRKLPEDPSPWVWSDGIPF